MIGKQGKVTEFCNMSHDGRTVMAIKPKGTTNASAHLILRRHIQAVFEFQTLIITSTS
jgi:hypothetical protein